MELEFLRKLAIELLENKFDYEYEHTESVYTSPNFTYKKLESYQLNILLNGIINMKRIISDFKKINYDKLDEKITAYYSILAKIKEICNIVYNYNKEELAKIIEINTQISEEIYTSV